MRRVALGELLFRLVAVATRRGGTGRLTFLNSDELSAVAALHLGVESLGELGQP
jgi:hypothetical protein